MTGLYNGAVLFAEIVLCVKIYTEITRFSTRCCERTENITKRYKRVPTVFAIPKYVKELNPI